MSTSDPAPRMGPRRSLVAAGQALRTWNARQITVAVLSAAAVALVVGAATVLLPNPVFGREIAPLWWNYPVWLITSAMSGLLIATYVRRDDLDDPGGAGDDAAETRTSRMGFAGAILAWFAVGCPVCNKLALLALGYSGAITWFTPVQPFLAAAALVLLSLALVVRLRGQVACPAPVPSAAAGR